MTAEKLVAEHFSFDQTSLYINPKSYKLAYCHITKQSPDITKQAAITYTMPQIPFKR